MTIISVNPITKEIKQYFLWGTACFIGGYLTSCYVHKPSKLEEKIDIPNSQVTHTTKSKSYKSKHIIYP